MNLTEQGILYKKPRDVLHVTNSFDLEEAIQKIDIMKEQIGYHVRMIEERSLEREQVTILPLLKSLFEDMLYVENIIEHTVSKSESVAETE